MTGSGDVAETMLAGSSPAPVIQPATAGDLGYVLQTWGLTYETALSSAPTPSHVINGLKAAGLEFDATMRLPTMMQEQLQHPKMARNFLQDFAQQWQGAIIKRSKVLTAVSEGKIRGFVVYEDGVLHWINVRNEHRKRGVGVALLKAAGLYNNRPTITAWTADLRHLGLASATYKPFWLRTT